MLRGHAPVVIGDFGGLWKRGDPDETPLDHFQDGQNFKFIGNSVASRDGVGIHQTVGTPLSDVLRLYNYPTQTANTLIVLVRNGANGEIYHVVNATTAFGPLLTIAGMFDFAFLPYNGRGYISPIETYTDTNGFKHQRGMDNQFLYVYAGDGTAARQAAGSNPVGTIVAANGAAGHTDAGFHLFGVVFETNSGYLTAPGAIAGFTTAAALSVSFSSVPVGGASVTKRHIVATKVITGYNGDTLGYQFFFIPGATINDNVTTVLANVSFFDADLLEDATHLLDNFTAIAAGVGLCLYHNRLCLWGEADNISLVRVSAVGEPEAISQIDGLLIVPPDGNPLTAGAELRDVFFVGKRSKLASFVDNGDVPSSWPLTFVDNAIGSAVHGIATVLDSGGTSTDYLIVANFSGINLFSGKYIEPALTWKIEDLWFNIDRNEFGKIQIVMAPIQSWILCVLPDSTLLVGDYSLGMDPKNMRWSVWTFDSGINTIAIVNIDEVIFGADL